MVGQMVIVTPPGSLQCSRFETDLAAAAKLVDQKMAALSAREKQVVAEHYQMLNNIASYGGAGYGATLTYFSHHVKNVEAILKLISDLYVKTYNKSGGLNSNSFFQKRKLLFMRLDNTLKTFVERSRSAAKKQSLNHKR